MKAQDKVLLMFLLLFVLIFGGTSGYMVVEGMAFLDALYMTVITISTVGFREVRELSDSGRLFTIFLISAGLFIAGFAVTVVTSFVIEGEFRFILRRRMMEKNVSKLKDHYIICGSGETGHYIVDQFKKRKVPFVVLEADPAKVEQIVEQGSLAILGDATIEEDLLKAGIKRATGVLCCLANDADNVFTVLTARELNPDLFIVSRAIDDKADLKLLKAGANKTVSPNEIGGVRMASLVLRPAVVSFLDVITRAGGMIIDLEEVSIGKGSALDGISLAEASIPERTGLIVMAVKRNSDETRINPGPDCTLQENDALIVLGQEEQVEKLKMLAR
ncbi:MAG: potassium channel protein [Bacillota bacterium]|nr:potassium channel protein [Bacillota bacterium]